LWLDAGVRSLFLFPDNRWINRIMEAASYYGRGWSLAILSLLLVVLGILLKKPAWTKTGVVSLHSLLLSTFVVQLLKHLAGRARPRLLESAFMFAGPSWSAGVAGFDSFPSGHAISTFALAVILARSFPGGKFFFYAAALLVSYSRVYVGAHFLSDIAGGAILGILTGHLSLFHTGRLVEFTARLEQNKKLVAAAAVVALAAVIFFHQLKAVPLFDVDEAVFAEATREMLETGDLITPTYNYAPRYDKPILFYWLMAAAFSVFGTNEFAARFWPALAGSALVAMTFGFAHAAAGLRFALVSALILATSVEMIALARLAITDMILTFFIAASLYGFYLALTNSDGAHSGRWSLIGWAAAGLAVLTKGPIGILFPLAIVSIFIAASGKFRARFALRPAIGVGLFSLIALPWYAIETWITNGAFLEAFLGKHNVERYLSVNSGHEGPWYYYLIVILAGFFPWSAFLPAAVKSAWKERRDDLPLFLLIWIAAVLVFFSLAQTKLPNYIAPLLPPMALLVGWWLDRHVLNEFPRGARAAALGGAAASLVVAAGASLSYIFMESLQARFVASAEIALDLGRFPLFVAALFVAFAVAFFFGAKAATAIKGFAALAVSTIVFAFGLIDGLLPSVSWHLQEPLRALSINAAGRLEPGGRLVVFGLNNPSILFYARRPATIIGRDDFAALKENLNRAEPVLVITRFSLLEKVSGQATLYPIERQGNYVLASNRPV
jgi:membrane-associated phospholipid phosphatase